jgi:glycosyltransferase involved in cell wall biosynthesis
MRGSEDSASAAEARGDTVRPIDADFQDAQAKRLAVVIPCHDEETSIGRVVRAFRASAPAAEIIVVDNASTDATARIAAEAGARVVTESRIGKGFALLTGFEAAGDADYTVMVDGDDTYPAEELDALVRAAAEGSADMVVGTRLASQDPHAFPPGHSLGNRLFIWLVRLLFGIRTSDLFSGYRVLSRRFLDTAPLVATGFDVEAELSVQARAHGFRVIEVPIDYRARGDESHSKLRTLHDGYRILRGIMILFRDYRPLAFFGWFGLFLAMLSLWSGFAPIDDFVRTGLVHHLPRAVLAAALFILSALSFTLGVLLSSINRRSTELAALIRKRPS